MTLSNNKLKTKLTDLMISELFIFKTRHLDPHIIPDVKEAAKRAYANDRYFHAEVNIIVEDILELINEHT